MLKLKSVGGIEPFVKVKHNFYVYTVEKHNTINGTIVIKAFSSLEKAENYVIGQKNPTQYTISEVLVT